MEDPLLTPDETVRGVQIPSIPEEWYPLRQVRRKYLQVTGKRLSDPAELRDSKHNAVFPLYQYAVYPGTTPDEGATFYYPNSKALNPQTLLGMTEVVTSRPWTFLPIEQSSYVPGRSLGADIVVDAPRPFAVYTKDARDEAGLSSTSTYYSAAFTEVEELTITTGLYGSLHMNQVVNMNLEDDIDNPNISLRKVKPEHRGILCSGHTAHSLEAGAIRKLAHGVVVRLWSKEEWRTMCATISKHYERVEGSDTYLCVGNMVARVSTKCVDSLVAEHKAGNMSLATLHKVDRTLHVNITPGVVLRRMGKAWYDSASLPRDVDLTLSDAFSTFFLTVPFITCNRPPRTLIASCQSIQGICHPYLYQTSIFRSESRTEPLVVTRFAKESGFDLSLVPGENLCIGLINVNDNYEDCFLLSRAAVERGAFKYTSVTSITVDTKDHVSVGERVSLDKQRWWCLPFDAEVISSEPANNEQFRITLRREGSPTDGDKFATFHGQKGVVKIMDPKQLPKAVAPDGSFVEFDLVIAVSSVVSRVTVGQVMELRAGRMAKHLGRQVVSDDVTWEALQEYEPYRVWDPETSGVLTAPNGRPVFCEWGYGRVQQLHHLTASKHHFTRIKGGVHTKYSAKGRVGGGSVRLGDMEYEALVSGGLTHCAHELTMRRDMSVVTVCVRCNRQGMLCDCPDANGPTRLMLIPYSTLVADTVAFLTLGRSFEFHAVRQG